ncbi:hypothetical protein EMPG_15150 [Blastomyces silverae]|uniref:Uncharacterized protein n=1 Tax=Blastomyces silverae TaxID=2060906 RepID=A0A0H1BE83_9EURO|nr:hypothetical protein EMPG_15150 [Blastomyces silverae]
MSGLPTSQSKRKKSLRSHSKAAVKLPLITEESENFISEEEEVTQYELAPTDNMDTEERLARALRRQQELCDEDITEVAMASNKAQKASQRMQRASDRGERPETGGAKEAMEKLFRTLSHEERGALLLVFPYSLQTVRLAGFTPMVDGLPSQGKEKPIYPAPSSLARPKSVDRTSSPTRIPRLVGNVDTTKASRRYSGRMSTHMESPEEDLQDEGDVSYHQSAEFNDTTEVLYKNITHRKEKGKEQTYLPLPSPAGSAHDSNASAGLPSAQRLSWVLTVSIFPIYLLPTDYFHKFFDDNIDTAERVNTALRNLLVEHHLKASTRDTILRTLNKYERSTQDQEGSEEDHEEDHVDEDNDNASIDGNDSGNGDDMPQDNNGEDTPTK